jgi:flagellar biosynthetic protein FliP
MQTPEDIPYSLLLPSFVTSELKTAFQIGFLIFIPFLIIDLVVASVLMAMGMMMLSPMLISLPFKLMLFVLIDGWALLMGTLASSFYL